MKASDVFRDANYVFSKKVAFKEAFPEIKSVIVEIEEGYGIHKPHKRRYTQDNIGEYIDCSNSICYNGGFSLGSILCKMVREKQNDLETFEICQGYEGSPKGQKRYRSCINSFDIKIHIEYEE